MNFRKNAIALITATLLAVPGLASAQANAQDAPTATAQASNLRLLALLPMNEGYGPAEQDAYETRIAPIAAEHGMNRLSAYSVASFLGGAGPKTASTFGVWGLASDKSLFGVMGDARYKANTALRDQIHDMKQVTMYLAQEEIVRDKPTPGHALLLGVLAMKKGFGFQDHVDYERAIQPITSKHGMKLVRTFRVAQSMGAGPDNIAIVSLWDLPKPEALNAVMSDPEYGAHISYRNLIHDMAASSMYFVAQR